MMYYSCSFSLSRYQGQVSAALVLGGVDVNGPYLSTVAPHGSTDRLPYVTMGSGSLAAMAVFEAEYKDDMTVCPAMSTHIFAPQIVCIENFAPTPPPPPSLAH